MSSGDLQPDAGPTEPVAPYTVNIQKSHGKHEIPVDENKDSETVHEDILSCSPTSVNTFLQYREDNKLNVHYSQFLLDVKKKLGHVPESQINEQNRTNLMEHLFLLMIDTQDFRWRTFTANLGYDASRLMIISEQEKHSRFVPYLHNWLDQISKLRYKAEQHLFWALEGLPQSDELRQKLKEIFNLTEPPLKPPDKEVTKLKEILNEEGSVASIADKVRYFTLCQAIWNDLTADQIRELKTCLHMTNKKFKKAALEKIDDGIDLLRILQERDLLRIDDVSYLKTLLAHIYRDDLTRKVEEYERLYHCQYVPDSNPKLKDLHEQEAVLLRNIDLNKTALTKLHDERRVCNEKIDRAEQKIRGIEDKRRENETSKKKLKEQITSSENKIKELLLELNDMKDREKMLQESENSQIEEEAKYRPRKHQLQCKKEKLDKLLQVEDEIYRTTTENLETIQQKIKDFHLQNNQKASSKIDTDAAPTDGRPPNTVSGDIMILSAMEDNSDMEDFKNDMKDAIGQELLNVAEVQIVSHEMINTLDNINRSIGKSKLLLLLLSQSFTTNYWVRVCSLTNFNDALYSKSPLIVPVLLKKDMDIPMGLKSANPLYFYRRDRYYTDALKKLLSQYTDN